MPYRYALRLADGSDAGDIGTFVTAAADCKVGAGDNGRQHFLLSRAGTLKRFERKRLGSDLGRTPRR
jgi:hypothetical protein